MSLTNKPMTKKIASNPLPPRTSRLLREAVSLVLSGMALYLALILFSFDRTDPSWSHSDTSPFINNAGGSAGAWLADLLLYLFGVSAWWWVILFFTAIWWRYRRIDITNTYDPRVLILSLAGFIILLIASSGIEALRFYTLQVSLPLTPGGLLGGVLSKQLSLLLGFTGATLILMVIFAVGISLFFGLSWVRLSENIGTSVEIIFLLIKDKCAQWLARRVEKQVSEEPTIQPTDIKERVSPPVPLHIEIPETPETSKTPIPKPSQTNNREKQAPLFSSPPNDTIFPPLYLLDEPQDDVELLSNDKLEHTSRLIERKLMEFGVEVKVVAAYPGPVITRYEIEPATGVKGSQIINLVKDLARALAVVRIRVVETIPGKNVMGLEIPNPKRQIVRLHEILASKVYTEDPSPLTIALGKDISGRPVVANLAKMPHVLVAGTTGSGKSVAINAIILSLIYKASPENIRLILIDPKMLELSVYEDIPHLLTPVVTDMRDAASALNWCVAEMERRYKLMSALGVRNLAGYNQKVREAAKNEEPLTNPLSSAPDSPELLEEAPLIVVVIDELADLMMIMGKKVEKLIARLAQKARAAGIHLLLATQRPSVDVITGLIKANIPTRIAFQVSSKIDSRTILDQMGAETLLGQGDMLYLPPGTGYPQRVHGAFVADHEVHKVVEYLKQHGKANYVEEIYQTGEEDSADDNGKSSTSESDPLYDEAVSIVIKSRRASISLVQRQLRIGYNRAARLVEEMERAGLVSSMQSNGSREVLVPDRNE